MMRLYSLFSLAILVMMVGCRPDETGKSTAGKPPALAVKAIKKAGMLAGISTFKYVLKNSGGSSAKEYLGTWTSQPTELKESGSSGSCPHKEVCSGGYTWYGNIPSCNRWGPDPRCFSSKPKTYTPKKPTTSLSLTSEAAHDANGTFDILQANETDWTAWQADGLSTSVDSNNFSYKIIFYNADGSEESSGPISRELLWRLEKSGESKSWTSYKLQ